MLLLLISFIWAPFTENPSTTYKLSSNSKITITGTSTLHIWEMKAETIQGTAAIDVLENEVLSIKGIDLQVPVESLRGGRSGMDHNASKALKAEQFPFITFELKGFKIIEHRNGASAMEITGYLTIAGKRRTERIVVDYSTDARGQLCIKGLKNLKMTDYGIRPPEVMFGTVKTSEDITLTFDLSLHQTRIL